MSQGAAATREPVATRPKASAYCENISDHFLVGERLDGHVYKLLKFINKKIKHPPKQNSYVDEKIYIGIGERDSKAEYILFRQ